MEETHISRTEVQTLIRVALGQRDDYWRTKVENLESRVRVLEQSAAGPSGGRVAANPRRVSKTPGRVCFCCGGGTAVHRHRDLGIPLDDKCRKQVETIRQGGVLTERREAWGQTLRKILPNARALEMLMALEGQVDGQAPPQKRRRYNATDDSSVVVSQHQHAMTTTSGGSCEGDKCVICQETANDATQNLELPCKHAFHRNCIVPWVEKNSNCPVCRAPTKIESAVDGTLLAVVGPPVPQFQKSHCGESSCARSASCSIPDISVSLHEDLQRSLSGTLLNGAGGVDSLTAEDLNVFLDEGSPSGPSNKELGGLSLSLDDSMAFLPLPDIAPAPADESGDTVMTETAASA